MNRKTLRVLNNPKKMDRLKKRLYGTRDCGTCKECCHILSIPELQKPAGEDCPHMQREGKGCGIYADRPYSCREWACIWRSGSNVTEPSERPDRLGVMFDTIREDSPLAPWVQKVVVCYEVRPGGHEEAAETISRIARKRGVVLIPFHTAGQEAAERRIVGPDEIVRPYVEAALGVGLAEAVREDGLQ